MKLQKPETPSTIALAATAALRPRHALAALAVAVAVAVLSLASPLRAAATWTGGITDPTQSINDDTTVTGFDTVTTPLTGTTPGVTLTTQGSSSRLTLAGTLAGYAGDLVVGSANGANTYGGELVLAGDNRGYTGNVTVGRGTLEMASGDNFGTGTITLYSGTNARPTLSLTGADGTIYGTTGTTVLRGIGTIRTANAVTWSGVLGEHADGTTGSLTKTGTGTLTLTAAHTYTGNTTIEAGTLALTGSGSITTSNSVILGGNCTFDISGISAATATIKALSANSNYTGAVVNLGSKELVINSGTSTGYTSTEYYGTFAGSGTLTHAGNGTTTLYGNSSTFAGTVRITGGTLRIMANANVGGTIDGGTLDLISSGTYTKDWILANNATNRISVTSNVTLGGTLTGEGGTLTIGGGTLTLASTLDGYAGDIVARGTLRLAGDNTGYTGNVTMGNSSILEVASNNNFGTGTYTLHGSGGGGTTQAILWLTGTSGTVYSKDIVLRYASDTENNVIMTTNAVTLSGVLSGEPGDGANDAGGLVKAGAGTLTLTGANTWTGPTRIQEGALVVSGAGAQISPGPLLFNSSKNTLTITDGATQTLTDSVGNITDGYNALVTVSNGATLEYSGSAFRAPLRIGSGATLAGTGTFLNPTRYDTAITLEPGSTLAPGAPGSTTPGTLTFEKDNDFALFLRGLTYAIDANATTSDKIAVRLPGTGYATFDGTGTTINFTRHDAGTWKQEQTWDILTYYKYNGNPLTVQNLAAATLNMSAADWAPDNYTGHWDAWLASTATALQVKTGQRNLQLTWHGTESDSALASTTVWQTTDGEALTGESFIANDHLVFGAAGSKTVTVGEAATVSGLTVDAAGYTFGGAKLTGTATARDAVNFTPTGALTVTATGGATFDNALEFVSVEIAGAAAFNSTLTLTAADGAEGLTVLAGGTLSGTGTITGNVSIANGGTLSPGNSPGALTVNGNVTLETGATALFELGGAGTGEYDRLIISAAGGSGTLTLGGTLELVSYNGYTGAEGDTFRLFDLVSGATVTGEFEGGINGFALGDGLAWDYSALYTNGLVSIMASAVPEPAGWAVLAGLALLAWTALRRPRTHPRARRV